MVDNENTILIVDDVQVNIILLAELLKKHYQVKTANNGIDAINIAKSILPDIILLDIMMPDMDGYEVCKILKDTPETKHIPIIFITAMTEEKDEEYALSLGAVDFITKPFIPALVKARVKTQLDNVMFTKELTLLLEKSETAYKQLKETQELLITSEKKNAVLAMAVTANHEINQPLMVISGSFDLLKHKLNNPDLDKYFDRVDNAIHRIEVILTRFSHINSVNFKAYSDSVNMLDLDENLDE